MTDLRANTETIVTIGPFPDATDGKTMEIGVTLSGADSATLKKHNSSSAVDISAATWSAITGQDGYYNLTLTTSHLDTEGSLMVQVQDVDVCLPVKNEFNVLSEAAYDSLYVAKDDGFMDVNVKTIGRADTQETEASNLEAACAAYSVTRGLTGTAVPAAAADGVGGLPISDAGGLDMDAILADTSELQGDWTDGGRLDLIQDAIKAVTDNLPNSGALTDLATAASIVALNDISAADVNAQVSDVIKTDTIAELSAVPAATPTLEDAIMWIYMLLRNKRVTDNTGGEDRIHNDADTVISEATISGTATAVTREKYGAVD